MPVSLSLCMKIVNEAMKRRSLFRKSPSSIHFPSLSAPLLNTCCSNHATPPLHLPTLTTPTNHGEGEIQEEGGKEAVVVVLLAPQVINWLNSEKFAPSLKFPTVRAKKLHNLFNIDKDNSCHESSENWKVEAERRPAAIIIFVDSSGHRPRVSSLLARTDLR